jgi:hypothetical protein
MTVERVPELDQELGAEEMALVLAAPSHRDPYGITDPIAVFGTEPLDLDRPVSSFGLALAA